MDTTNHTATGTASGASANERALQDEIARLNKIVLALMNRAERSTCLQGSDFGMFQTAVILEAEVRKRTDELEAALRENARVRQLRAKNSDFCRFGNVAMRVCGVFFVTVVWGHVFCFVLFI